MRLAVLGLGYVGSVTAACLATNGHDVVGVDPDPHKVDPLQEGRSPIIEAGVDELICAGRQGGTLQATASAEDGLAGTRLSLVCVGTPSQRNGSLDLRYLERVAAEIGHWLASAPDFHAVVFRSTMVPGTVNTRLIPILERESRKRVDVDFGVAVCPEFLREGSAVSDFFDPPLTLCGVREARTESLLRELFGFLQAPFHAVEIATAESVKYACNTFHALKIAFANEIARVSHAAGADSRKVMRLLCEDDHLNISKAYLRPGFAFGGSCLPKDLRALLYHGRMLDQQLPLLEGVLASNEQHLRAGVREVLATGERQVALLGLSFKAGTDDLRESPYVELAETLIGKGIALRIYDPHVNPERLFGANRRYMEERLPHLSRILSADPAAVLDGAGCAILATTVAPAREALLRSPPPVILDLTGTQPAEVEGLPGFQGLAW
jgi:GDP-mannose 6-dehydrogenase